MPRRCLLATAQGHIPASLDDGVLGAHRRRLLHRANGRVLDLSDWWEPNLLAYHRGALTSLVVTGRGGTGGRVPGVPEPEIVPRMADAPVGDFDTVVVALTLCTADRPADLLRQAGRRLVPGGRLLVFEADAAAVIHLMDPQDMFPYKQPQMRKVFAAFDAMLRQRAGQAVS